MPASSRRIRYEEYGCQVDRIIKKKGMEFEAMLDSLFHIMSKKSPTRLQNV
ncbi:MAG: hypothetical protein ACFFBV_11185 [Promethearchaeota archaeon]